MTSIIIILILLTQQNIEIFQHNYSNNISVQFLNVCQWPTGHEKKCYGLQQQGFELD